MSSTDLKNPPFNWDLLYNLYEKERIADILDQNQFKSKDAQSIFVNFFRSHYNENEAKQLQEKQKVFEMYKYNAYYQLDPISCYRLAEYYSMKTDLSEEANFQYTWFYLLLYTSLIEPLYDIDFFKGIEWLKRIIKQADSQFIKSIQYIKELMNPIHQPLIEVVQNLALINLDISFQGQTNQQRYTATIDKLINILQDCNEDKSPNLKQCAYNILLGLSFRSFKEVQEKHSIKILQALSLEVELTFQKVQEQQIESQFSKYQLSDNFFSQRLRRTVQQLHWIVLNMKCIYTPKKNNSQSNEQKAYGRKCFNLLNSKQQDMIKQIDNILSDILQTIYTNNTVKNIIDLIICRRMHAEILFNNNKFEQSLNIISQELQIQSLNINSQAYAELSKQDIALKYGESSLQNFKSRIQQIKDPIILLQCYYYKGRLEYIIKKDISEVEQTFIQGLKLYIDNYNQFKKESCFQHISLQRSLIQNIQKISKSQDTIHKIVQNAKEQNIILFLPKSFNEQKPENLKPTPPEQKSNHVPPIQIRTLSFGKVLDMQRSIYLSEIQFFGMNYQLCLGDEEINILSFRENASQNTTCANSQSNLGSTTQSASVSSFQSIRQYRQNEMLNNNDQFVFELTKQFVLNDCNMIQINSKDIKMKSMIRKGDLGAVYGIRYNQEFYAAKQLQKFLEFQNKLPYSLNLLQILGYSTCTNQSGAINLYLISEMKRSNLQNSLLKNEIIKLEQKIKIIEQIIECVATLHKNNIYHSNIKDTNILIDVHCNTYISDLSVSRILKDYEFGENSFKQPYSAPEQEQESGPTYGKASDMWAIGIIAFQLLTNIKQFSIEQISSLNIYSQTDFKINLFQTSEIPEVNKLEIQMTQFIESLLRYDPKKRINAQQAQKEFQNIKLAFLEIKKIKS